MSDFNMIEPLHVRLRAARESMRKTREVLAFESGIPANSLRNYELGLRAPSAEALEKLAQAGIAPAWLLLGQEPMLSAGPPRSQLDRLRLAIEAVEEGLQAIERTLPPKQKAELVLAALELLAGDEANSAQTKGKLVQLLRLAA